MSANDRLTIKELETSVFETTEENISTLAKQLLDTMRENERLKSALKFYAWNEKDVKTKNFDWGKVARDALSNKDSGMNDTEKSIIKGLKLAVDWVNNSSQNLETCKFCGHKMDRPGTCSVSGTGNHYASKT